MLIQIPNRKQATLKRDPKTRGSWIAHFHRPSQVVLLSVSSEQWLCASGCEPQAGRVLPHRANLWRRRHCDHQLRRRLVGRLKQYLRQRKYGQVGKRAYGQLLAEFMWRKLCSAFRTEPLRNLFGEIQAWFRAWGFRD